MSAIFYITESYFIVIFNVLVLDMYDQPKQLSLLKYNSLYFEMKFREKNGRNWSLWLRAAMNYIDKWLSFVGLFLKILESKYFLSKYFVSCLILHRNRCPSIIKSTDMNSFLRLSDYHSCCNRVEVFITLLSFSLCYSQLMINVSQTDYYSQ